MQKGSLIAVITAAAVLVFGVQVASAQYPDPKSSLVCAVNQVDVQAGGSTTMTATLRDIAGNPLAGNKVNFTVISGEASLASSSATTDRSGVATTVVNVGTSGSAVVVHAASESSQCQASTNVSGIVPPSTGDAGLAAATADRTTVVGVAGLGVALLLAGALRFRARASN